MKYEVHPSFAFGVWFSDFVFCQHWMTCDLNKNNIGFLITKVDSHTKYVVKVWLRASASCSCTQVDLNIMIIHTLLSKWSFTTRGLPLDFWRPQMTFHRYKDKQDPCTYYNGIYIPSTQLNASFNSWIYPVYNGFQTLTYVDLQTTKGFFYSLW